MQIRNQDRRFEEEVPFSEVAKYLANALNPTAPTSFNRSGSSAYTTLSLHSLRNVEETDVSGSHEDARGFGKSHSTITSMQFRFDSTDRLLHKLEPYNFSHRL